MTPKTFSSVSFRYASQPTPGIGIFGTASVPPSSVADKGVVDRVDIDGGDETDDRLTADGLDQPVVDGAGPFREVPVK